MARTRKTARHGGRAGAEPGGGRLAGLGRRFAEFRAQHGRGARVPLALRGEVLSALEDGATWQELKRTCGVTWGQVAAWRARGPGARVFSVVEEPVAAGGSVEGSAGGEELVLRVGRWSVTVRLEDDGTSAGGGRCCR